MSSSVGWQVSSIFLPPYKARKEQMNKKDREVLELRLKILKKYDKLQFISQLSWKFMKMKERLDINSSEINDLLLLQQEVEYLYKDFLEFARKEVQDEK